MKLQTISQLSHTLTCRDQPCRLRSYAADTRQEVRSGVLYSRGERQNCHNARLVDICLQVTGDDVMPYREDLAKLGVTEMFSGKPLPSTINSMNAYYGAGPIVNALNRGAEIVVTGRATDSALALAPLMAEFGWGEEEYDKLAAGSLAGHLIECGAQCTGGNHTDWEQVRGFDNMGFPVAEVSSHGEILISKPAGTGGVLSVGSVGEQMLYEIGDPACYQLPDVTADFSQVSMLQTGEGVMVKGARGRAPGHNYKISATYMDGYKVREDTVTEVGYNFSALSGHGGGKLWRREGS